MLAIIKPGDALADRGKRHLSRSGRLHVPFAVGIELLLIAKKHKLLHEEVVDLTEEHFEVERLETLRTAARCLDKGRIKTVFDAVHAAEAFHAGTTLHTADERLLASGFPTTRF
ncbi:MAG: PIN domain-containing protein [Thermoplasmatota archaeon]